MNNFGMWSFAYCYRKYLSNLFLKMKKTEPGSLGRISHKLLSPLPFLNGLQPILARSLGWSSTSQNWNLKICLRDSQTALEILGPSGGKAEMENVTKLLIFMSSILALPPEGTFQISIYF